MYNDASMNVLLRRVSRKKDNFGKVIIRMLMVILYNRKSELVHVPGNLTVQIYQEEIIQPYLMYVIGRQREIFQHDNDRPHTTSLTMDYQYIYFQ